MKNRYDHDEAAAFVAARPHCSPALALRVYTSRLIGREPALVLHGGGNTSVKDRARNILGEELEVLHIKGSGWDLGAIEAAGFPGLELAWLRRLRGLASLGDEEMVNQFRTHMLDAAAPNPSIETLVHAFLPHRFIDHTHADAIVILTHLPEPERHLRAALGPKIGILPFIMPGFPLARAMADLYEADPGIEAVILLQHGIFTFADEAEVAYGRMIEYVSRAEAYLAAAGTGRPPAGAAAVEHDPARLLPLLRGALSFVAPGGERRYFSLAWRAAPDLLAALARPDAAALFGGGGVLTPDHVIRTKNHPLLLNLDPAAAEAEVARAIAQAVAGYGESYQEYFARRCRAAGSKKIMLDPRPRVILIPGLGLVGAGFSPKEAAIAADIAEHTLRAKLSGAPLGPYLDLEEEHIFAMEYWSLEQAKLGQGRPSLLAGRVALVTGGGGAMALGIAARLLEAGARVFLSDLDQARLEAVAARLKSRFGGGMLGTVVMDVTAEESVRAGLAQVVQAAGGLDILVPNAGIAHVARLEELTGADFARVMAVNCQGVFTVIKGAIPLFRRQACGGQVIINSSKNVFDPGAAFGAYSASKAAAHQLGKIAALELAELGVGVNMINADGVFDADGVSSGLWEVVGPDRMRARNLDPAGLREYYRNRNLLKVAVSAEQVGNAVVFFAAGLTPTTGATLPVDGGIPAAFPR
ncbi:bifunctional aldolase/short-chain dehydrogenase [Desulfurivibrio sp. D14AmB]|uniref:bifunctional aldolase/short-chain dehydrogenase n=1 Tax=Desulfurivibrio sp. D14AmB TaxID=3374370 RepID=UPI00376F0EBF